jgi:cell division septation protein DedD
MTRIHSEFTRRANAWRTVGVRAIAVCATAACAIAVAPLTAGFTPLVAAPLAAQEVASIDQVVGRARALVESGNGRAGRLLLDSLVARTPVGTPALGELLYWRGLLSESGSDAERDWRRLLLEVPMSPRAEDATLRLAQLELTRGRAVAARTLLERMARDYSEPASQARAHFWLARVYFDENDKPRACGALDVARRDAPTGAVELRTQVEDLRSRCRGVTSVAPIAVSVAAAQPSVVAPPVTTARVQRPPVQTPPVQTPRVQTPPVQTPPPASTASANTERPANARYSVQLAAYSRADQAADLVRKLAPRGVEARVDGTSNPFRVRTGYFATRAQASARLAELKAKGIDGFVAELTP